MCVSLSQQIIVKLRVGVHSANISEMSVHSHVGVINLHTLHLLIKYTVCVINRVYCMMHAVKAAVRVDGSSF